MQSGREPPDSATRLIRRALVAGTIALSCASAAAQPAHIKSQRIWDKAPHNAFTDLAEFDGRLYCTFREGARHVHGDDGRIRVIVSADDGASWKSAALLAEEGVDLRDPKISITPDDRLMIVMGGSFYDDRKIQKREPRISFSDRDRLNFSDPQPVLLDASVRSGWDWLWRVTWHEGDAWGVVYRTNRPDGENDVHLMRSKDGVRFERVSRLPVSGKPNETTLRFLADGTLIALMRREGGDRHGVVLESAPPYVEWEASELPVRLGGPNFVVLDDGALIAGSRAYREDGHETVLARLTTNGGFEERITLPSGGDTSYPGMLVRNDMLYVSYYSSHEGEASIYLAKIGISHLKMSEE